jgi:hypothetical protein|tara:strand:- start:2081 stop:2665 length:585 start_codon:yes stop_codon:yes gene_type:complete
MSNIFQNMQIAAFRAGIQPRTKESQAWFRQKANQMRRVNRAAIVKEEPIKKKASFRIGGMYMFTYDPKTKDKMPYYDTFPLVIPVEPAAGGFYGLNLHYIPPLLRAKLLDALMDNLSNKKYDDSTRMRINYKMLQAASKYKHFAPCFKHYLTGHVQSKFAEVSAPEWEIAAFLPMANFQKSGKRAVYADSRKKI